MKEKLKKLDFDGWLTVGEGECLYDLIISEECKAVVEIGSWKGRSTSWLIAAAAHVGGTVFAVDHFKGSSEHQRRPDLYKLREEFDSNIYRAKKILSLPDSCLQVRATDSLTACHEFENESIDLLFIDASHEYEAVRADVVAWLPKVKSGGIIAMHDTAFDGPAQVKHEFCSSPNIVDSLAWWKKL